MQNLKAPKMPGGSVAESLSIEAPSTHHQLSPMYTEDSKALDRCSWANPNREHHDRVRLENMSAEESRRWTLKHKDAIAIRSPAAAEFVYVDYGSTYRADELPTLKDELTGEFYLLSEKTYKLLGLFDTLWPRIVLLGLALTASEDGSLFLWPFVCQSTGNRTLAFAVREAMYGWVRVVPDMPLDGYRLDVHPGGLPDPVWPKLTEKEVLAMAFGPRVIKSLDHPVITRLAKSIGASLTIPSA